MNELSPEHLAKKPRQAISVIDKRNVNVELQLVDSVRNSKPHRMDLVEMAKQIETADRFIKANACSKLSVIAEQVRFLQGEAQRVLEEAAFNAQLHKVACNFQKIPGTVYHLYRRDNSQKYFSMISPLEWGVNSGCPHEFLGSFKLEFNMSWTPETLIDQKEKENKFLERILVKSWERNESKYEIKSNINISMKLTEEENSEMEL